MPAPEVKVSIAGDNAKLDAELRKSEGALGGFVNSAKGILAGLAAAATAVALGQFFKSALEEAGKAETGIKRLGIAVTNAGGDFRSMQPEIEGVITKFVRLTKHTDDDLRAALTNMIGLTGDVSGSLKNLGLATDLAAFKQIPLEDAATAVARAMNGNVTAFNRLGIAGKDATTVLEAARQQFGGFAEGEARTFEGSVARISNEWGEFKEAIGTAILSSGAMEDVTSLVVKALVDLQAWVVRNEDEIGALVSGVAKGVIAFGQFLGKVFELGAGIAKLVSGPLHALDVFFGFLPKNAQTGFDKTQDVEAEYQKSVERMGREHTAQLTALHAAGERDRTKAAEDGKKAREKLTKEEAEKKELLIRDTNILLTRSEEEMNKELAKQKVNWSAILGEVEKVTTAHRELLPLPKELADYTDTSKKHVEEMSALLEDQGNSWAKNVDGAVAVARGLLDGAHAMGALSDEAASALGSVLNLADAVAQIAGGDIIGGIVGVVGSLANILAGLGTSPQEKARLQAIGLNSQQLERLTAEVGDLNLSSSGRQVSGVTAALVAARNPETGFINRSLLGLELRKRGLSEFDLNRIAKELNIDLEKTGEAGFAQLLDALQNRVEFGRFGQGFEGQLDFTKSSVDILGLDTNQQLKAFTDLAKKFSPAFAKALGSVDLNTPEGRAQATKNLQSLFAQLNAGTLKPEDIGVSGPQFLQLIQTLLPLLTGATGLGTLPNLTPPTINPVGIGANTSAIVGPRLQEAIAGLGQGQSGGGSTTINGDTQIGPFYITPAEGTDPQDVADRVASTVAQVLGKRYIAQLSALGTPVGSSTANI